MSSSPIAWFLMDVLHVACVLGRHQQDFDGGGLGPQTVGPIGVEVGRDPRAQVMDLAVVLQSEDPVEDVEPLLAPVPGRRRERTVGIDGDAQGLERRRSRIAAARRDGKTLGRAPGTVVGGDGEGGVRPLLPEEGADRRTQRVGHGEQGGDGRLAFGRLEARQVGFGQSRQLRRLVERQAGAFPLPSGGVHRWRRERRRCQGPHRHTTGLLSLRQQKLPPFTGTKHGAGGTGGLAGDGGSGRAGQAGSASRSRSWAATSWANRDKIRVRCGRRAVSAPALSAEMDCGVVPARAASAPNVSRKASTAR